MSSKKRGAEIQLTREQGDEDEIEEVTPAQGFRKADETVLASRPMRGLPKRNNAFGVTNDAPSTENKSNFAFGAPISSTPFTFNASLPTSASSTIQPTPASSGFKFSAPVVSSSASAASKQLSSLLGSAPQPNGLHGSVPSTSPSTTAKDSAETKYFTSLRGLNQALKEEISKRLNSDPFADLEEFLDGYKAYRTKIQKEYDASKPHSSSQANGTSQFAFGSKPAATPAQPLSMPTPPKSFAGFGASSTSTSSISSTAPATGGFKPNFGATSSTSTPPSTFTFGATSMKTEKTTADPSLFAASSSTASHAKPSPFGASATTNKPSPFGVPASSSSPFGFSSTSTTDKTPFSLFGSETGTSSTTKADTPSNTTTAPPNIFGSGGGAGASGSSGAISSSTPVSSSGGFSFGGAKSPSSGNLGNPVGFSFGSKEESAKEPASTTAAAAGASTSIFSTAPRPLGPSGSSGFSFGSTSSISNLGGNQDVSAKSSTPGSVVDSRGSTPFSTEGGEAPPPEDTSTPKPLGENPNDLEGEGEENEETVHTSRVKIYRFGKKGDQPHWADIGVGMLRIKKHKETTAMRLLSRNSANGKIMMNFRLYTGFKVSRAKQVLNFVGHDEGANVTFRVRVKDEAGAIELQEAIERAVSSL